MKLSAGLLRLALAEDSARGDVTTRTLIPPSVRIEAEIRSNQPGIICGLPLAQEFFRVLDRRIAFIPKVRDGQKVGTGSRLAVVRGSARAILSGERPALNLLQHLSGIATLTHQMVSRVRGRTKIYDTRKTLPGWRELEKYAVRMGGGKNHRMRLDSALLIKDNHLKVCRLAGVDWMKPVKRLMKTSRIPVEMEVQSERDLAEAIRLKPNQVLLDNLPAARLRAAIKRIRRDLPQAEIEISGGVRPDQLPALSRLNVERISMGKLTHSAPALDINLEIIRVLKY